MIFAFCTLGDMTYREVQKECKANKFVPLLVYIYEGEKVLPYFSSENACRDFCRRNLPRKWLWGAVHLDREELEKLATDHDISAKMFEWPRKIKDFVKWDIIIHEFIESPDISAKAIK